MTREEIFGKVQSIICEELSLKPENVTETSSLKDDLGADSLDAVEIVMQLEDNFGVSIPDEEAAKMAVVSDLIDYIEKNI